jgi:hypothetical protein
MTPTPTPIDQAAYNLWLAKEAEETAKAHRLACEEALIHLIGLKEEGTKTEKTSFYKVSVTQPVTRSLTADYGTQMDDLPAEILQAIVKWKPQIDVSELKALAALNPEQYRIACRGIVAKPGKAGVKVEQIIQKQEAA